jgi:predicted HicB family RNase H-like nuclease
VAGKYRGETITNKTVSNTTMAGQPVVISSVPELLAFRGKFLGLTGYCDFVSDSIQGLQKEAEVSLREYLEDCASEGIEPYAKEEKIKTFTLRYLESFAGRPSQVAAEHETSVNTFIIETMCEQLKHA